MSCADLPRCRVRLEGLRGGNTRHLKFLQGVLHALNCVSAG